MMRITHPQLIMESPPHAYPNVQTRIGHHTNNHCGGAREMLKTKSDLKEYLWEIVLNKSDLVYHLLDDFHTLDDGLLIDGEKSVVTLGKCLCKCLHHTFEVHNGVLL